MNRHHCHKLIRATAQDMAGAVFDEMCSLNNRGYAQLKANNPGKTSSQLRARFIIKMWPKLVEDARTTLAQMLGGTYDEKLKAEISDALIKDNELRHLPRRAPTLQ